MKYSIKDMAQISGLTPRTLRYYEDVGLINPNRITTNKYRCYDENDIEKLQMILFYRNMDMSLEKIKQIINNDKKDKIALLSNHLIDVIRKKDEIELLIENINKAISNLEGEKVMKDKDRFKGLKSKIIEENEENYGKEIRKLYGQNIIDDSNEKILRMSEQELKTVEELSEEVFRLLKLVVKINSEGKKKENNEIEKALFETHRAWLCHYWPKGMYNEKMHGSLADMYIEDERFKKYYDNIVSGGASTLSSVIKQFTNDK